jgi:hypothetical protein
MGHFTAEDEAQFASMRAEMGVDDDPPFIIIGLVFLAFVSFPFVLVALTTACVARSRTKEWDRKRRSATTDVELNETLLNGEEDDFLDSEDEADFNERKAEVEADSRLTFNQKWRKEFRSAWKGRTKEMIQKEKEREERKERRKLAKAVAQEMERREARRAMKAARQETEVGDDEALPPYRKN